MKTPSHPWRLLLALAAATPALSQQPTADAPLPSVRQAVFSTSALRESETDTHPSADRAIKEAMQRVTRSIINSKQDLCMPGYYRVQIELVVEADGTPAQVQWTATNNIAFAEIEVEGVKHWHFSPGMLNGRAVPCIKTIPLSEHRPEEFTAVAYNPSGDPYAAAVLAPREVPEARYTPDSPRPVAGATVRTPVFTAAYLRRSEVSRRPIPDHAQNQAATQLVTQYYAANGASPWNGGGMASLAFIVDTQGNPTEVQWVQTTNPAFAQFVVSLVSKFKYAPATLNGRPVPCLEGFTLNVN